jgi:hypothetical protein
MPRLSPLPERLRYLEPFRKQVARLKPEEIDESMDLSLLNKLLLERIKGIPIDEGKAKIKADSELLETWLSSPGLNDNGGMMFLQGYFMALPELVDRLLEEKDKPIPPQQEIQIDFPAEAKLKKMRGGLLKVSWLKTTIFVLPCDKEYRDYQIKEFREGPSDKLSKVSVTQVKFGNVTGFRRFTDISVVGSMNVDYALEIPGGYAAVTLLKKGTAINPSQFEQFFHTLRIT